MAQQKAVDEPRQVALARAQNLALQAVTTEWVLRLADDDALVPSAVERLIAASEATDIVYGPEANDVCGVIDLNGYSQSSVVEFFRHHDTGQASGDMYRTTVLREVRGWCTDWHRNHFHHFSSEWCLHPYEDRATRSVLAQVGAHFRMTSEPTWIAGLDTPDRIGQTPLSWQACR